MSLKRKIERYCQWKKLLSQGVIEEEKLSNKSNKMTLVKNPLILQNDLKRKTTLLIRILTKKDLSSIWDGERSTW